MSLAAHILKKDMRRLRLFLMFWIGIVLLTTALSALKATTAAGDIGRQQIVEMVHGLASTCQFIMLALIVPFLVQSEPLIGDTAFWLTRPIRKTDALLSKGMFAGIFLIALPVLSDVALHLASGVPVGLTLMAIPEQILHSLALLTPLFVAAALTRNFGFYALVLAVYLVAQMILSIIAWGTKMYSAVAFMDTERASLTLLDSRALLASAVAILFGAAIILSQYLTRRPRRGFVLLGVQLVVAFWLATYAPWEIFREPANLLSAAELARVTARLDPAGSLSISEKPALSSEQESKREISGELLYAHLPPHSFAEVAWLQGDFDAAEESIYSSYFGDNYLDHHAARRSPEVLAKAIQPLELIRGRYRYASATTLLQVSPEEYEATRDLPGDYAANVDFHVYQYQLIATLPLKVGARHQEGGTSFVIDSVPRRTDGCAVVLREQHFNLISNKRRTPEQGKEFLYLLVNRERNEAFLPEEESNHSINPFQSAAMLESRRRTARFVSQGDRAYLHPINDAWLDSAELMIVQVRWLGRGHTKIAASDFEFGANGGSYTTENDQ